MPPQLLSQAIVLLLRSVIGYWVLGISYWLPKTQ